MSLFLKFSSILVMLLIGGSIFVSNDSIQCLSIDINNTSTNDSYVELSDEVAKENETHDDYFYDWETYEDLTIERAKIKFGSDLAIEKSKYYGSCLVEGIPIVLNNTRLIHHIFSFVGYSHEQCYCKCLEFNGCVASIYVWGTCYLYDINHDKREESGFTTYLKNKQLEFSYIGCFKDEKNNRDLDHMVTHEYLRNSNAFCASECHSLGYAFFGTQNGIECHCGNSYGSHGRSDSCNTPCGSTFGTLREETCGGTLANSVYLIGDYSY